MGFKKVIRNKNAGNAPRYDTTDNQLGKMTAHGENLKTCEGMLELFDNKPDTKWLDFSPAGSWIQYKYAEGEIGHLTTYTMTSANDCNERDPSDWQLLGSNDGEEWTVIDTQKNVVFRTRFQKKQFPLQKEAVFKTFRLNITRVRDPDQANSVQLGNMEFIGWKTDNEDSNFRQQPQYDTTDDHTGTIDAHGENFLSEGIAQLFDNSLKTKWLDVCPRNSWVQYEYPPHSKGKISAYSLTSANDCPERDPACWILMGSDDGEKWSKVDKQTDQVFAERFFKKVYVLKREVMYKMYRLRIEETADYANEVQLGNLELLGQIVEAE